MKAKQLTPERVAEIAASAAHNVAATGACAAEAHNTKTVESAIITALVEAGVWTEHVCEVCEGVRVTPADEPPSTVCPECYVEAHEPCVRCSMPVMKSTMSAGVPALCNFCRNTEPIQTEPQAPANHNL
jgi:hypothetical protein